MTLAVAKFQSVVESIMRLSKLGLPIFLLCLAGGYLFSHRALLRNFQIQVDEGCALSFINHSKTLTDLLYETKNNDAHPPLYNLILFGIDRAVGLTLESARWPSLLAATLSLLLMAYFGFKFEKGLFFLIMPFLFWRSESSEAYSIFARSYAIVFFLTSGVWCIYLYYFRTKKFLKWPLFLACLLGLYAHYFFLILMGAIGLFVCVFPDRNLRVQTLKFFGLALLGFLPWFLFWVGSAQNSMNLVGDIALAPHDYLKNIFFMLYYTDLPWIQPAYEALLFVSILLVLKRFVFKKFEGPLFSRKIPMRYWSLGVVCALSFGRFIFHQFWFISDFAFALILFDRFIFKIFEYETLWDYLGATVLVVGFLIFFRQVYFQYYLLPLLVFALMTLTFISLFAKINAFARFTIWAQLIFAVNLIPYFFPEVYLLPLLFIPFFWLGPNYQKLKNLEFELPMEVFFTLGVYSIVLAVVLVANAFNIPVTKMRYLEIVRFVPLYVVALALTHFLIELFSRTKKWLNGFIEFYHQA